MRACVCVLVCSDCFSVDVTQARVIEEGKASVEVIRLAYGHEYLAYSCLMVDVKGINPEWMGSTMLGRWF